MTDDSITAKPKQGPQRRNPGWILSADLPEVPPKRIFKADFAPPWAQRKAAKIKGSEDSLLLADVLPLMGLALVDPRDTEEVWALTVQCTKCGASWRTEIEQRLESTTKSRPIFYHVPTVRRGWWKCPNGCNKNKR